MTTEQGKQKFKEELEAILQQANSEEANKEYARYNWQWIDLPDPMPSQISIQTVMSKLPMQYQHKCVALLQKLKDRRL